MEQRALERGSSGRRFSLPQLRCLSPATIENADSFLWPSTNSTDSTTSFVESQRGSSPLEKASGDDASQKLLNPTHSSKHYDLATSDNSDEISSPDPVLPERKHETRSYTTSQYGSAEESSSRLSIQTSEASSPTSLEESIIAYFAAHNLETPGFSQPFLQDPTEVHPTALTGRHSVEPFYSNPEKRSSYKLSSVAERDTGFTRSAPEKGFSKPLGEKPRQEVQRRRFGPLWTMDNCSLINLATDVRKSILTTSEDCSSCRVISRLNGSYNVIYILQFEDGLKYVIRLPALGWGNRWTLAAKKAFESQVLTMHLIRRMTDIPLPEIFAFDATQRNSLETPYMVMSFISGFTVEALWYNKTGPTPLEERRSRILSTTAMAMAQLQKLKFDWIGSLQLNGETEDNTLRIGPCYEWNLPSRHAELRGQDPDIREFGPFRTTKDYLNYLHNLQEKDSHPMAVGCRELLDRMIASFPLSLDEALDVSSHETFVLTAPDFDSQNFIIDEQGNLTGIMDWDHVLTMPRCLGYCRYPAWITHDCDPLQYEHLSNEMEDSPMQLRRYRQQYAAEMIRQLRGQGDARFARKSHIFEAVWIAVARCAGQVSLIAKLLDRALARDQYLNKFALMEDIGKGSWKISRTRVMDGIRELFEVRLIETLESASTGIDRSIKLVHER
ncbi:hypothetical protein MMC07_009632 [Pseudocyphellaria aurata]|nr:hypothetical protein [Pseudocyphellaria aurata]